MNNNVILLANNLLPAVPAHADKRALTSKSSLATVLANLAYFGFAPNALALKRLAALSDLELADYWADIEPSLKTLTGDDRKMDRFVVYKNFPREVLEKSQAEYWFAQILMYLGCPNEWFTEREDVREPLNDKLKLKVLALAGDNALDQVFAQLVSNKARWTADQQDWALWLARQGKALDIDLAAFGFKENGLVLISNTLDMDGTVTLHDATDVMRLAAVMSDADVALRENVTFKSFTRSERRFLLALLEDTKNLEADVAAREQVAKRLLARLHPGDFKFPRVSAIYDRLYQGKLQGFNGMVEGKLAIGDDSVLADLSVRPGEYMRRLHKLYAAFGMKAVRTFEEAVAAKLSTLQLLKVRRYLSTVNGRAKLMFAPKGNWGKVKVVDNEKKLVSRQALAALLQACDEVLSLRMMAAFPQGVAADARLDMVKLQTNDQELAPYGRGTVFPIPDEVTFIRTASYWACPRGHNVWFDNGVNFFDENWNAMGTCCWNANVFPGAAFSGDPTNSKDLKGRACQMIDLYPQQLVRYGARYAVWNILCYSNIAFDEANDVLATLQWGVDAQSGKLYEPSRAQMVFPLRGKAKTKYVAYIDFKEMKLVYMDANFPGHVHSASSNLTGLAEKMPAFVEYLASLPSVGDLIEHAPKGEVPMLYSDEEASLTRGKPAYVFRPSKADNNFKQLDLAALL